MCNATLTSYHAHALFEHTPPVCNIHLHVLMRDESERRKKQARSNKQQGNLKQRSTPKVIHHLS